MPKIQPTTTISIDNASYEVVKMSPEVQQMIEYLDEWRQKESDISTELLLVRAALRDLQNTLLTSIQKERADAVAKAEAMGLIPPQSHEGSAPAAEAVSPKRGARKAATKSEPSA